MVGCGRVVDVTFPARVAAAKKVASVAGEGGPTAKAIPSPDVRIGLSAAGGPRQSEQTVGSRWEGWVAGWLDDALQAARWSAAAPHPQSNGARPLPAPSLEPCAVPVLPSTRDMALKLALRSSPGRWATRASMALVGCAALGRLLQPQAAPLAGVQAHISMVPERRVCMY